MGGWNHTKDNGLHYNSYIQLSTLPIMVKALSRLSFNPHRPSAREGQLSIRFWGGRVGELRFEKIRKVPSSSLLLNPWVLPQALKPPYRPWLATPSLTPSPSQVAQMEDQNLPGADGPGSRPG